MITTALLKERLPGSLLAILIAIGALLLSPYVGSLGSVSLAIILGLVLGNTLGHIQPCQSGIRFCEKQVLTYAIVLMGFKLQLSELSHMGWRVFGVVLPMMAVTIGLGLLLGRWLGYSKRFSILMGVGNAVCGASAIAAVAPAVHADEEEIGISIGIVNLLGTLGIFLLPLLAHLLHLADSQSAYLVGGDLQAIGQVVAAGFAINDQVGDAALLIKMLRVLMLGPVVILISMWIRSQAQGSDKRRYIPSYIIGFTICSLIGSLLHHNTTILPVLQHTAKLLLLVAMAAVGFKIRLVSLLRHGPKALLFGLLVTGLQLGFLLTLVLTCV